MTNKVTVLIDVVTRGAQQSVKSFQQSIRDAAGTVGKFRAGTNAAFDSVKANAGALAIGAGTALIGFGVKAVTAFQDLALAAGKFSEATGIAVEDASRLIEVSGDLGVEAGTVEAAIARMNKSLADGKAPTDDLTAAIKRGADGNIDSKETFINLITEIGKIKDPTLRAKAAQETFGRSYTQMAELMALSADELRMKLGAVADEKVIDERELRSAREFREALDNLRDRAENFAIQVGGGLVPALTDMAEVVDRVGGAIDRLAGREGGGGLAGLMRAGYETLPGLGVVGNFLEKWDALFGDNNESSSELGYSLGILGEKARRAEQQSDALTEELEAQEEQADRTAEAWQRLKDELEVEEQLDGIAEAFDNVVQTWVSGAEGIADESITMEQAARDTAGAVRDLKSRVIEFGESVGGLPPAKVVQINALIDQGKFAEAERMIALLVRRREFPISPRVVVGGAVPKFATGTSSAPAGMALVGEQGPELVQFSGGERVIPAGQTRQMLGAGTAAPSGGAPTIIVNAGVGDPVEIGRKVAEVLRAYERSGGRV